MIEKLVKSEERETVQSKSHHLLPSTLRTTHIGVASKATVWDLWVACQSSTRD